MNNIRFVISKELTSQLVSLNKRGGNYQLAAKKVKEVLGDINISSSKPLEALKLTNNGESRIKHCIKYDLNGGCRLITIQNKNLIFLSYVGTHEECERWLNANKGLEPAIDKEVKDLKNVFVSQNISVPEHRLADDSDYSEELLINKLKEYYIDFISELITGAQYIAFSCTSSKQSELFWIKNKRHFLLIQG